MAEELAKLFIDFVAEYGILAAIVFGMLWNDRVKSKQQSKVIQDMLKNARQETKQQSEIIEIVRLEAVGKAAIIASVEALGKNLLKKADDISDKSHTVQADGHDVIQKNTESVTNMNSDIERLIAELAAMRKDIQDLKSSVNTATNEIKHTVMSKTTEYEGRLKQVEESVKKITQETPAIPKALHPIPKKPGVPVTPKPTDDEPKQEKTE